MRLSPTLFAVVLGAASIAVAHAQTASFSRAPSGSTKASGGMSFAYDAQHDQINASGVHLSAAAVKPTAASPTIGTIDVTINIKVASHFPRGTVFHCSVSAIGGLLDLDTGTVDGGLETAFGIATAASGGTATCFLSIPYSWTLPHDAGADTGLILAFGASAVNDRGGSDRGGSEHRDVLRSTLQIDGIENLPASGTTSKFAFDVAL